MEGGRKTKAKLGRRAVLLLAQFLEANQGVPGSRHKSVCASISFYAEEMSVRRAGSLGAAIWNQIGDNCMEVINFTPLWGDHQLNSCNSSWLTSFSVLGKSVTRIVDEDMSPINNTNNIGKWCTWMPVCWPAMSAHPAEKGANCPTMPDFKSTIMIWLATLLRKAGDWPSASHLLHSPLLWMLWIGFIWGVLFNRCRFSSLSLNAIFCFFLVLPSHRTPKKLQAPDTLWIIVNNFYLTKETSKKNLQFSEVSLRAACTLRMLCEY